MVNESLWTYYKMNLWNWQKFKLRWKIFFFFTFCSAQCFSYIKVSLVRERENMVGKSDSSLYGRFIIQKGFIRPSLEWNKGKWTLVPKFEMFVILGVPNIESLLYLSFCSTLLKKFVVSLKGSLLFNSFYSFFCL